MELDLSYINLNHQIMKKNTQLEYAVILLFYVLSIVFIIYSRKI